MNETLKTLYVLVDILADIHKGKLSKEKPSWWRSSPPWTFEEVLEEAEKRLEAIENN